MSIFAKMPGRICIFACDPIQSYDLVCVLLQHNMNCPATCALCIRVLLCLRELLLKLGEQLLT